MRCASSWRVEFVKLHHHSPELHGPVASGAAQPRARRNLVIILSALPGILLVSTQIWAVFGTLVWSVGSFLIPGLQGQIIAACIFLGPAIWGTWITCAHAIASETELAEEGW